MEQQSIPLKDPDQLDVEVPSRYSEICRIVGDLYLRASLQAKHIESQYADKIRNLEAQVQVLIREKGMRGENTKPNIQNP